MNKKEKMDLLLSKVKEDVKESFIAEFREAKTKEDRFAIAKKYGATLTEDEVKAVKGEAGNALSDDELAQASGGCSCSCHSCYCGCG